MDTKLNSNTKSATTKLVVTALFSAVAIVLQYLEVSIPIVPSFLKLDFSDLPELLGAFAMGPTYGVLICLVKNLVHLLFTSSFGVGELSNFLLGAVFAFTAGVIYKYKKTKSGAIFGSLTGAFLMAMASILINYFIVYPVYAQLWAGGNMNIIIDMYKIILPASDTLLKSLIIFNVPFTFCKGLIVSIITFFIYKPLSGLIGRLNTALTKNKNG